MSRTPAPIAQDFVPFATTALDFHRALNMPEAALVASRAELDALHAHLIALYGLLDAHARRTGALMPAEGDLLRAAGVRIWQAADRLHAAYHAAPKPGSGDVPDRGARQTGRPESATPLAICRRHRRTACLVRRRTTPADLRAPFTG